MTAFLNPERQHKLRELLSNLENITPKFIEECVNLVDDLHEVDLALACHAECIIEFNAKGKENEMGIGLANLVAIMCEAKERGLSETDFPVSFEIIKTDVERRHSTSQ